MKIVGLVENTTYDKNYKNRHGLSLYIETTKHKILFDLGPDNAFISNAERLGIALEEIDTVIISHGHNDHGGGLKAFLEVNKTATIYIQRAAFEIYKVGILGLVKVNIGIDESLKNHPQVKLIDGSFQIDKELQVFTNPRIQVFQPEGNKVLYKKADKGYEKDDFKHEQNLIVQAEDKHILIAGCAHRGITNIINEAELIAKRQLDYIIGGFHLMNPISITKSPSKYTTEIGNILKTKESRYYTCHCTGEKAYKHLKEILGGQIDYIHTGTVIEI